jgi:hypothetical protein
MQKPLETKQKKTKEQLDTELLQLVHTLRGQELIKIKKDDYGKPGRIIVQAESTTYLDYSEENKE